MIDNLEEKKELLNTLTEDILGKNPEASTLNHYISNYTFPVKSMINNIIQMPNLLEAYWEEHINDEYEKLIKILPELKEKLKSEEVIDYLEKSFKNWDISADKVIDEVMEIF